MKFLRNVDRLYHSLASSQARIFESSVSLGIPSKIFIRSYMVSEQAKLIDDLKLDAAGLSEIEIIDEISSKITIKKGQLYPFAVMHFIGYFYRTAAYLTGSSSRFLYQNIKPDLLYKNYETLHSLSMEETVEEVFALVNIQIEDKYFLFKKIYKMDL